VTAAARGTPHAVTQALLQLRYQEAVEQYRMAKTTSEQDKWASVMAVTISELQAVHCYADGEDT
jgi:hypothetical protein